MKRQNAHNKTAGTASRSRLMAQYKQHLQFAEEKASGGDRIGAENHYQHAEHYWRSAAQQQEVSQR